MQNTTRFALFILAAAATMAGFEGGCGATEPQALPRPSPTPTPQPEPECVDLLEEAACVADASCRAIFVETECACAACEPGPGGACPPCECPPPSRTFVGCEDRSGCDGLAEAACSADNACEPIYSGRACISVPPPGEGAPCAEPGCGCNEGPVYEGCRDRTSCPLILCTPCEFGAVVDQNGCATCECLPPPDPCTGLGEAQCVNTPGCLATYDIDGRGAGIAPPCDCLGENCTCPEDPPANPNYTGCVVAPASCQDLDEAACNATRGCHAEYAATPCFRVCPEEDPNCSGDDVPACPEAFIGCYPDQVTPECWSDADCGPGFYCDNNISTEPAPGDGSNGDRALPEPDPAPPPPGGVCVEVRCGDGGPVFCDALPPRCGPGQVAGEWQGCWACFDARSCTPVGQSDCFGDADCIGGYCEDGAQSGGGAAPPSDGDALFPAPPPPVGYCVYPVCGDQQPVLCDAIPPTCGIGQVAGSWNGCYACFDARTCQPVNQTWECEGDADCPNGYCGDASGADPAPPTDGGARPFIPPTGMCVFPSCDDGSTLMCRSLPPTCGAGEVVSLINGCWQCRDARTCSAPCDPSTTDCG